MADSRTAEAGATHASPLPFYRATFKDTVAACASDPLVPVILSENVPVLVVVFVVTVRVDVSLPVTFVG